ncbi:hypothetical protein [Caballeronia sp. S22]|uniref:hypothetical protein n=1 Tax=Caballeronia sp. S22 TaxID=3137182 RepID=UPI0035316F6F
MPRPAGLHCPADLAATRVGVVPTVAHLLGLSMPHADGRIINHHRRRLEQRPVRDARVMDVGAETAVHAALTGDALELDAWQALHARLIVPREARDHLGLAVVLTRGVLQIDYRHRQRTVQTPVAAIDEDRAEFLALIA